MVDASQLETLRTSVEMLAADPTTQLTAVTAIHPDELALQFDDGYRLAPQLVGAGFLTNDAAAALDRVDAALRAMSGPENASLWTDAAIRESRDWQEVRLLAAAARDLMT